MIAVSNTTPLRYLLALGQQDFLKQLFERIFIPSSVLEELTASKTPAFVRDIVTSSPNWISAREVSASEDSPSMVLLHKGERDAILLCEMIRPDFLLLDDQAGRTEALRRNLPLSGTLGVLERADLLGKITDFPNLLGQLKASGFFLSATLEKTLLERHTARKTKSGRANK